MDVERRANARMVRRLAAAGLLPDGRWRRALLRVPRHLFVPDTAWARLDRAVAEGHRIDRAADPAGWLAAVYSDTVIVTQVDDGTGDPSAGEGDATSSVSAPGVVMLFLRLLGAGPGDRVLEIGTGSGWTAALLAARTGPAGRVVSLEVDEALAARAVRNLAALPAGPDLRVPEVRAQDAATAAVERAAFDRLHATCAVDEVPWAWIEALRVGGTAVVPWSPPFGAGSRLGLTRTGPAEAQGRFDGPCGYMMLRSERRERHPVRAYLHDWDERRVGPADRPVTALAGSPPGSTDDGGGDLAVAAQVPGVAYRIYGGLEPSVLLYETGPGALGSGSWALVEDGRVHAHGPRDLYAEVAAARDGWHAAGEPGRRRFGITLTPAGRRFWLDDPSRPWPP